MQIREMHRGEEAKAMELVKEVFTKFVAPYYVPLGIDQFMKYIELRALKRRLLSGNYALFLAEDGGRVVGVLELRDYGHISLLFVAESYQGYGLARSLFNHIRIRIAVGHPGQRVITVNASPNAKQIYEKLGFNQVGIEQEVTGIKFIPMEYYRK